MNLKNKITTQCRNKVIDTENILIIVRWRGVGGLGNKGKGIKKYTLVKNGQRTEQPLLQGHTEGPETYERMLSITSHERDAN